MPRKSILPMLQLPIALVCPGRALQDPSATIYRVERPTEQTIGQHHLGSVAAPYLSKVLQTYFLKLFITGKLNSTVGNDSNDVGTVSAHESDHALLNPHLA